MGLRWRLQVCLARQCSRLVRLPPTVVGASHPSVSCCAKESWPKRCHGCGWRNVSCRWSFCVPFKSEQARGMSSHEKSLTCSLAYYMSSAVTLLAGSREGMQKKLSKRLLHYLTRTQPTSRCFKYVQSVCMIRQALGLPHYSIWIAIAKKL